MSERDAIVCQRCGCPPHRHSGGMPNTCPIVATYLPPPPCDHLPAIVVDDGREAIRKIAHKVVTDAGPNCHPLHYADQVADAIFATHAGEVERLREALDRQCDNMAFVLNKATLPDQWYCKFSNELQEARQALEASR